MTLVARTGGHAHFLLKIGFRDLPIAVQGDECGDPHGARVGAQRQGFGDVRSTPDSARGDQGDLAVEPIS